MPLVSILIPTFNQGEYIGQAIQSAAEQDYPELEIIVADDASTDASAEVAAAFCNDPRITLHRNPVNLGRTRNYRQCLYELARGEWVLFLDGDDYLCDRTYVSDAMKVISGNPETDLIFANAVRIRDDLNGLRETRRHENRGLARINEGRELFLSLASRKISLFHNTCIYRRAKAMELDFYREDIISSDWESLHRYILTGKVAFLERDAAVWRIHGENASKTMSTESRMQNLQSILGPYRYAKSRHLFSDAQIDAWLEKRLERAARKDVRSLLKYAGLSEYARYMRNLKTVNTRVFRKLQRSPRLFLRRLRAWLETGSPRRQTETG